MIRERKYLPPFAELIDRLTVDQIKEVLLPDQQDACREEMSKLSHDIDLLIDERGLKFSAKFIRIVIAIAQLNLHIWNHKDKMGKDPDHYLELLKVAHQLNGIRNQLKNILMEAASDKSESDRRTNFNTDGLDGWELQILKIESNFPKNNSGKLKE